MTENREDLSNEALTAIEAGLEGTTPGPWYTTGTPWFRSEDGVLAGSPDGNIGYLIADCDDFSTPRDEYGGPFKLGNKEADAAHIARCDPDTIRRLIAEVRAARLRAGSGVRTKPVTREDAVAFLETACRNWPKLPKLSEEDIGDVATALLQFSLKRSALVPTLLPAPAEAVVTDAMVEADLSADELLARRRLQGARAFLEKAAEEIDRMGPKAEPVAVNNAGYYIQSAIRWLRLMSKSGRAALRGNQE